MELYNVLGVSALLIAIGVIIFRAAPRRTVAFWLWLVFAMALVALAIALPIGLFSLPT